MPSNFHSNYSTSHTPFLQLPPASLPLPQRSHLPHPLKKLTDIQINLKSLKLILAIFLFEMSNPHSWNRNSLLLRIVLYYVGDIAGDVEFISDEIC